MQTFPDLSKPMSIGNGTLGVCFFCTVFESKSVKGKPAL
jgi:hypothetical protein